MSDNPAIVVRFLIRFSFFLQVHVYRQPDGKTTAFSACPEASGQARSVLVDSASQGAVTESVIL
ncbi:hypothetical protein [Wenxinia marina]|uniref:hypothetical protein n=1 Tax=Wenxinia marina TaxID=390641 RepID=UPI0012F88D08|nr:hypothetical protein [Wenxinia marina]